MSGVTPGLQSAGSVTVSKEDAPPNQSLDIISVSPKAKCPGLALTVRLRQLKLELAYRLSRHLDDACYGIGYIVTIILYLLGKTGVGGSV